MVDDHGIKVKRFRGADLSARCTSNSRESISIVYMLHDYIYSFGG